MPCQNYGFWQQNSRIIITVTHNFYEAPFSNPSQTQCAVQTTDDKQTKQKTAYISTTKTLGVTFYNNDIA